MPDGFGVDAGILLSTGLDTGGILCDPTTDVGRIGTDRMALHPAHGKKTGNQRRGRGLDADAKIAGKGIQREEESFHGGRTDGAELIGLLDDEFSGDDIIRFLDRIRLLLIVSSSFFLLVLGANVLDHLVDLLILRRAEAAGRHVNKNVLALEIHLLQTRVWKGVIGTIVIFGMKLAGNGLERKAKDAMALVGGESIHILLGEEDGLLLLLTDDAIIAGDKHAGILVKIFGTIVLLVLDEILFLLLELLGEAGEVLCIFGEPLGAQVLVSSHQSAHEVEKDANLFLRDGRVESDMHLES